MWGTDKSMNEVATVIGTLAIFFLAVGVAGRQLEETLRRSFLDEVKVCLCVFVCGPTS